MPIGSGFGFKNFDMLDPDPAENGPDPQPCLGGYGTVPSLLSLPTLPYGSGTVPDEKESVMIF